MQKALITGISGFVGPYLKNELVKNGYEVFGLDRDGKDSEKIFKCDLLDKNSIREVVKKIKPNLVFHLAGFSSVQKSWENPKLCSKINVEGTKNLLEAIVSAKIKPKILIVSSAEVYGNPKKLPVRETSPLNPRNPYAKSRIAQEKLLQNYKNIDWVISRSFNHTGPGQPPIFVIPEFAKQLAEIKKGLQPSMISVGNLNAKRDFSDVRDVVCAYRLLLEKGKKHEIYNVCSRKSYLIKDLLNKIINLTGKKIKIMIDKNKLRPIDIIELTGDNKKLKKLGFRAKYNINKTIRDSYMWWINYYNKN